MILCCAHGPYVRFTDALGGTLHATLCFLFPTVRLTHDLWCTSTQVLQMLQLMDLVEIETSHLSFTTALLARTSH